MDSAVIASFLMLAVPAYFTPGPNNLMLMTSAAKFGVRRTVPHALGVVLGFPLMVFGVGLGLGEIFAHFPVLKDILKYAAAVYLLWMAWHLLGLQIGTIEGRQRPLTMLEAALFQWINPKAWAMATSLAVAFVAVGPERFASLFWLTVGCLALVPFSTLLWIFFGRQLHAFLVRTGTERHLGAILALLVVGAVILFLV